MRSTHTHGPADSRSASNGPAASGRRTASSGGRRRTASSSTASPSTASSDIRNGSTDETGEKRGTRSDTSRGAFDDLAGVHNGARNGVHDAASIDAHNGTRNGATGGDNRSADAVTSSLSVFGKGLLAGLVGWFLPTFFLWLVVAICLLLFSMESKTTLTGGIAPVSVAAVLLSQGVGVRYDFLDVTLIPLLGTILYVAVGGAAGARMPRKPLAFLGFALTWLGLDCVVFAKTPLTSTDSFSTAAGKFLIVIVACIILALGKAPIRGVLTAIRRHVSQPLARTLDASLRMARAFLIIMAVVAFVTFSVWVVLGFDAMRTVASFLAMGNATFWASMALTLLWLPNLCLWALSWAVGPGFSIGSVATFTMWNGNASNLPAIPVFGIFPTAIADVRLRTLLVGSPAIVAFLVGCYFLFSRTRIDILHRRLATKPELSSPRSIVDYLLTLVGMCLSSVWIVIACLIAFALCRGNLGTGRLQNIGVADIWTSTQAISKPAAIGFFCSLGVFFVINCIQAFATFLSERHHAKATNDDEGLAASLDDQPASIISNAESSDAIDPDAADADTADDQAANRPLPRATSRGSASHDSRDPRDSRDSSYSRDSHDSGEFLGFGSRDFAQASEASQASHGAWRGGGGEPHSIKEALDSQFFPSESSLPAAHSDDDAATAQASEPRAN